MVVFRLGRYSAPVKFHQAVRGACEPLARPVAHVVFVGEEYDLGRFADDEQRVQHGPGAPTAGEIFAFN